MFRCSFKTFFSQPLSFFLTYPNTDLGHNVDGVDPDSCTNVLIENSVIRAGDDCIAVYSMQGPTRNVLMRNLTCYTPLSVTHGKDTRNVTFDNCTVIGQWGNDATQIRPRWFKTATRLKTDRNTNITMSDITFRNIVGVGVDLLIDIQSWYPYVGRRLYIFLAVLEQMTHASSLLCPFFVRLVATTTPAAIKTIWIAARTIR